MLANVALYPNPASETVRLSIPNFESPITATIFSVNGTLIISKIFTPSQPENEIDISSLMNGIYFVKMETVNGSVVKWLIKE